MSAFPVTSLTLLQKIAVQVTGEREAAWVRFFGLYEPAIKRFVAYHDSTHDPDDVVQDIFLKLVNVCSLADTIRQKAVSGRSLPR